MILPFAVPSWVHVSATKAQGHRRYTGKGSWPGDVTHFSREHFTIAHRAAAAIAAM